MKRIIVTYCCVSWTKTATTQQSKQIGHCPLANFTGSSEYWQWLIFLTMLLTGVELWVDWSVGGASGSPSPHGAFVVCMHDWLVGRAGGSPDLCGVYTCVVCTCAHSLRRTSPGCVVLVAWLSASLYRLQHMPAAQQSDLTPFSICQGPPQLLNLMSMRGTCVYFAPPPPTFQPYPHPFISYSPCRLLCWDVRGW